MDGKQRRPNLIEQSTYKDVNGVTQVEIQQREELETHGIGGLTNYKKDGTAYPNENDLRKEQGMNNRAAYNTEYNQKTNGELYKPVHNKKNE